MLINAFSDALILIVSADSDLIEILLLSVKVSFSALAIAGILAMPLGTILAISHFRGRKLLITFLNAMMGLPPVVVGLFVYLMLSRSGPLGILELLYTPTAMIIAQVILIIPIIASLTYQVIEELNQEYRDLFLSLKIGPQQAILAYLWDARYSLFTTLLAGFGRAISEVGAVMIVGGNINHLTRIMTTAIALETSKGELSLALSLGIVLLTIALLVNAIVMSIKTFAAEKGYV
jgi:tungstate transport system permease protein